MTFQAIARLTNRESLCIGEITDKEVALAAENYSEVDGFGIYLLLVDNLSPKSPGKILAKFTTEEAAMALAKFFRLNDALEAA